MFIFLLYLLCNNKALAGKAKAGWFVIEQVGVQITVTL